MGLHLVWWLALGHLYLQGLLEHPFDDPLQEAGVVE